MRHRMACGRKHAAAGALDSRLTTIATLFLNQY